MVKNLARKAKKVTKSPKPKVNAQAKKDVQVLSEELQSSIEESLNLIKSDTHSHPDDKNLNRSLSAALKQHQKITESDPNAPKRPELILEAKLEVPKQENPTNYDTDAGSIFQDTVSTGKTPQIV